mmetsp:Transcript_42084/g.127664  ORF Transcript_42084/g.127664 Transcript_42084/m.127664 type:complete len:246 (-) Transcript_42084:316-1053(-)
MAFIQDQIARFHRDVMGLPVMRDNLDWPILIDILSHINDRGRDQRQPIHVGGQNRPLLVHANSVERRRLQFLPGPLLNGIDHRVPHSILQLLAPTGKFGMPDREHVRGDYKAVRVRVPLGPVLGVGEVMIVLPEFRQEGHKLFRGSYLFDAKVRVVLHRLRLQQSRPYPVRLADVAPRPIFAPLPDGIPESLAALPHEFVVGGLLIPERRHRDALELGGSRIVLRIDVVREPGVVFRDGVVVHGI